jgi:hypothetical protein
VRLTASPIPAALLLQAVAFLKAVFKLYHREAVALLAWPEGRPGQGISSRTGSYGSWAPLINNPLGL